MHWESNQIRLLFAAIVVIGIAFGLYLYSAALFPFVVAGTLSYLLFPISRFLDEINPIRDRYPKLSRIASILAIYTLFIGVVVGIIVFLGPALSSQAVRFFTSLPALYDQTQMLLDSWTVQYLNSIPPEITEEVEGLVGDANNILVNAGRNVVLRTVNALSRALTLVIGLASVPILLYYLLSDREKLLDGFASLFPSGSQEHVRNAVLEVNSVLASYIRSQLLLGLIVGVTVYIGLLILGVRFPLWLALVAGLFELVPIIGPWIGAIPGVLVVLATAPEKLPWVVLLYFGIQQVENTLLVPRIQGQALRLHPVVIILILILGSELAGLWGVIIGPPLVGAAMRVFWYFRSIRDNALVQARSLRMDM